MAPTRRDKIEQWNDGIALSDDEFSEVENLTVAELKRRLLEFMASGPKPMPGTMPKESGGGARDSPEDFWAQANLDSWDEPLIHRPSDATDGGSKYPPMSQQSRAHVETSRLDDYTIGGKLVARRRKMNALQEV